MKEKGYKGFTVWLTGLSGSGKTTLANLIKLKLQERKVLKIEILDGDIIRTNLSKGLGFSKADRDINVKRVGFVCRLLTRNGIPNIAALITPYRDARNHVRGEIENFVEVHVNCPLEVCEKRDTKGLYKKARAGEIKYFTGVNDPYEQPDNPEVICNTDSESAEVSAEKILKKIEEMGLIPPDIINKLPDQ